MNYKKLMFAVRISVRDINPSEAIKSRTDTFPVILVILSKAKNLVQSPGTVL